MNSIAAYQMVKAIDDERHACRGEASPGQEPACRRRGRRREVRGRPVVARDPSLPAVHHGHVEGLTSTRDDPPGPHGPGVFAPVTRAILAA